ncbi:hypothetical protein [Fundidesulfovibrio putealis]|uniref:hypothetical protein n=1 Tax=Fundidesulfovibrio putealis TaxID=270496 RepID=UPI0005B80481|nr:hypothetical protein [Fundidesulfovibrio putealis]
MTRRYAVLAALAPLALVLTMSSLGWAGQGRPSPDVAARLDAVCGQTGVYGCYTNHRYGYVVAWPKKYLTGQGESDSGDGQVFSSPDGQARLACWASFNDVLGESIGQAYAQALQEAGAQVSYKHLGKDFFVISGVKDGMIFYRKTLLAHGVQASFELSYAEQLKAAFDPIVKDVARSFSVDPAFTWR